MIWLEFDARMLDDESSKSIEVTQSDERNGGALRKEIFAGEVACADGDGRGREGDGIVGWRGWDCGSGVGDCRCTPQRKRFSGRVGIDASVYFGGIGRVLRVIMEVPRARDVLEHAAGA